MPDRKSHWEKIYSSRQPSELSWHLPHLNLSLELIRRSGVSNQDFIIDVGGGESTLADDLLDLGFGNISVLDVSAQALDIAQRRLGNRASIVTWIADDILSVSLPEGRYHLWHDRAVFHFLIDTKERRAYVEKVRHSLRPGGHLVISTFSLNGPPRCSGLEVHRHSPETLSAEFGPGFRLLESVPENHRTPSGTVQAFTYCLFEFRE